MKKEKDKLFEKEAHKNYYLRVKKYIDNECCALGLLNV